jgi:hypothetical protein
MRGQISSCGLFSAALKTPHSVEETQFIWNSVLAKICPLCFCSLLAATVSRPLTALAFGESHPARGHSTTRLHPSCAGSLSDKFCARAIIFRLLRLVFLQWIHFCVEPSLCVRWQIDEISLGGMGPREPPSYRCVIEWGDRVTKPPGSGDVTILLL